MPQLLSHTGEPGQDLSGFTGTHFIYTYANGWRYEWYARNERACDYRVRHGRVGGRWVRRQETAVVKYGDGQYKADWHEPTGTCVNLMFDVPRRLLHGTVLFPQWIAGDVGHPEKTMRCQNEFVDDVHRFRDEGPAYPYVTVPESARITYLEQVRPGRRRGRRRGSGPTSRRLHRA
ncbi:phenolic acid decarboxylase [Streptomyces griseoviridis]|uniref:Phenolic acid decarboxylase n=1 Tax=Streptomyces griseoviridis TaxID=45398 RepID=A0A918GUJ3_STRGD|nr:phenolic acid decarboxylase [Streptomyces niveoruber]GGS61998.1 phenolic acid decarboxylase [Streptomyces niveoruber]